MQQKTGTQVNSTDIFGKQYDVDTSELTWRPSAYAIVLKDKKIMLVKHNGKYHLPGGGMELGESPEEAVLREFTEETGLRAINPDLLGITSTFFTYEEIDTHEHRHVESLLIYFKCDLTGDEPQAIELDEYEKLYNHEFEWVAVSEIDTITVGTTVDWRHIVKKAIAL